MMNKKIGVSPQAFGETGVWNISGFYALRFIGEPLKEINELLELARFGSNDIIEHLTVDEYTKSEVRIHSLKRALHKMRELISNTKFVVKKDNKIKLENAKLLIERIKSQISKITHESLNQKTKRKTLIIDEKLMEYFVELSFKIIEEMREPLNEASLIFSTSEEIDPEEMKRRIAEEFIENP